MNKCVTVESASARCITCARAAVETNKVNPTRSSNVGIDQFFILPSLWQRFTRAQLWKGYRACRYGKTQGLVVLSALAGQFGSRDPFASRVLSHYRLEERLGDGAAVRASLRSHPE